MCCCFHDIETNYTDFQDASCIQPNYPVVKAKVIEEKYLNDILDKDGMKTISIKQCKNSEIYGVINLKFAKKAAEIFANYQSGDSEKFMITTTKNINPLDEERCYYFFTKEDLKSNVKYEDGCLEIKNQSSTTTGIYTIDKECFIAIHDAYNKKYAICVKEPIKITGRRIVPEHNKNHFILTKDNLDKIKEELCSERSFFNCCNSCADINNENKNEINNQV